VLPEQHLGPVLHVTANVKIPRKIGKIKNYRNIYKISNNLK